MFSSPTSFLEQEVFTREHAKPVRPFGRVETKPGESDVTKGTTVDGVLNFVDVDVDMCVCVSRSVNSFRWTSVRPNVPILSFFEFVDVPCSLCLKCFILFSNMFVY